MPQRKNEPRSPFMDVLVSTLLLRKRRERGFDREYVAEQLGLDEELVERAETRPALVLPEVIDALFDFYQVADAIRRAIGPRAS